VSGPGLTGHLELVCAVDAGGRSYIREQSFCAPIHLSKPHLDAGVLVVNVANPTAGLFAGDRVRYQVAVESGARLLLTAPSASRAHRIVAGDARVEQEFRVAAGGWLESWPELFIPQGGARYRQRTSLHVEEGGEALQIEMIAPGRAASGEAFAFAELDWQTDVFLGPMKIGRERYVLTPDSPTLGAIRARFPAAYYASDLAPAAPRRRVLATHPRSAQRRGVGRVQRAGAWRVGDPGPRGWKHRLAARDRAGAGGSLRGARAGAAGVAAKLIRRAC
jgi:urease accessory protein